MKLKFAYVSLALIFIMSIFARYISPFDPNQINLDAKLLLPNSIYLFGTDNLGRDVLSRIIFGGRVSIVLAILATTLSMGIGLMFGVIAGYFSKGIDLFITTLTNILQALPSMCFMVAIIGIIGPGVKSMILGLVITSWTGFSRVVRTETLKLKNESFVEGLKCFGLSDFRIIFKHIIPNILPNLISLFTIRLGRSLLSIAGLSFLELGIKPPTPDWSVMINDSRMFFRSNPNLLIIPGIFIFISIFSINIIGEHLRNKIDVRNMEAVDF